MKPLYDTKSRFTEPRFAFLVFGIVIAVMIGLGIAVGTGNERERPAPSVSRTTTSAPEETSGYSTTCGSISGKRAHDLRILRDFCRRAAYESGFIESAHADGSLLVLKVPQVSADVLMIRKLNTEQLLIDMMAVWKILSDTSRVTIRIEWRDVVIAEAKSTRFRGDAVTIKD